MMIIFGAGIFEIVSYLRPWAMTGSLDSGLGFTMVIMLI